LAVSSSFSPLKFDFPAPDGEAGPRCRATSDPNDNVLYHSLLGLASKCPTKQKHAVAAKIFRRRFHLPDSRQRTPASVMALLPATATGAGSGRSVVHPVLYIRTPVSCFELCHAGRKIAFESFTNRKFRDAGKAGLRALSDNHELQHGVRCA